MKLKNKVSECQRQQINTTTLCVTTFKQFIVYAHLHRSVSFVRDALLRFYVSFVSFFFPFSKRQSDGKNAKRVAATRLCRYD